MNNNEKLMEVIDNMTTSETISLYNILMEKLNDGEMTVTSMVHFETFSKWYIEKNGIGDYVKLIQRSTNFRTDDDLFYFNEHGNLESRNADDNFFINQICIWCVTHGELIRKMVL